MKYIIFLSIFFTSLVNACGDDNLEQIPFAYFEVKYSEQKLSVYRIVVPRKSKEYLLTSLEVEIPDIFNARLEFDERSDFPEFYSAFLWLNENQTEQLIVRTKHSTTEDGKMLLCGEFVNHKFTELLKAGKGKKKSG